ncbi:MAG: FAD-dependent oxidoreductase [bacterium]
MSSPVLVLGAGLSGLSASFHIGHEKCLIFEKDASPFGHIRSEAREGFTWDQGPHVSFTKSEYVRDLFAESVSDEFEDYPVRTRNYYHGHWIDHPAQSNLHQVPEPLRSACLESFLEARKLPPPEAPRSYQEWLDYAMGPVFAKTFSAAYTRKYWTVSPEELETDWIGKRVFYPTVEDVVSGFRGPLSEQTHYITHVRYPSRGGYQSFARKMAEGANLRLNSEIVRIDLDSKRIWVRENGNTLPRQYTFNRLINTIPLPVFISLCDNVPSAVTGAADQLNCSQLLLVNITAPHPTQIDGNWFYIYNEDFHSTRINCTEKLSPHNAPEGSTGIQVEVYAHPKLGFSDTVDNITRKVVRECVRMGFVNENLLPTGESLPNISSLSNVRFHTQFCNYANVICDHDRKPALATILNWLELHGLNRDDSDLAPFTDWNKNPTMKPASLELAGRFAEWKYFWTDDCVLRGRSLSPFSAHR